nr:MAG TPA: hypothetical protein [Caudoviricetes sp.]DAO96430.1 MAG TPA: hypothetical protein [Caudoviricetes sp.]
MFAPFQVIFQSKRSEHLKICGTRPQQRCSIRSRGALLTPTTLA